MTDLTYCYLHMTKGELDALDTIDDENQLPEDIEDPALHIPSYLRPPDPMESEALPEEIHNSYPFGNPNDLRHPASRPRRPMSTSFYTLLNEGPGPDGIYTSLQWQDLNLDTMSVLDPERVEAERMADARRRAATDDFPSVARQLAYQANHPQPTGQPQLPFPRLATIGQPELPPVFQPQTVDDGDIDMSSGDDDEDDTGDETASAVDESGGSRGSGRRPSEGEESEPTNGQSSEDSGSTSSSTQSSD